MSRVVRTPLVTLPSQGTDEAMSDAEVSKLYDGYIEQTGSGELICIKRPGIQRYINSLGTYLEVQDMYWWETKQIGIAVSGGKVFKITDKGGTVVDITGDALLSSGKCTFADNGAYLVIANGGKMVYTDGDASTAYITDPDAPQEVTHVASLDGYLIAFEKGTDRVRYTDFLTTQAPTSWSGLDFFTAESSPDGLLSMHVHKATRTIYLFGSDSTELWIHTGAFPLFQRIQTAPIGKGIMAKDCVVEVDGNYYYFDNNRRLNVISGIISQEVVTPFDDEIQDLATVSDCVGYYIHKWNWLMYHFESDNRTFVYDLKLNYWAEFTSWLESESRRNMFMGISYAYMRGWNLHLFGGKGTDSIYTMKDSYTDDDGVNIHHLIRTGHIDHGVPDRSKTCISMNIRAKTGVGISSSANIAPTLQVRYRDEGQVEWSNTLDVSLSAQGKQEIPVMIHALGRYYVRQWELLMSDSAQFQIGKAQERIDLNVH